MNVTDIKSEAPAIFEKDIKSGMHYAERIRDMLEEMFKRQHELELKYEHIEEENGFSWNPNNLPSGLFSGMPMDLNNPQNQWFIKDGAYRMIEEISEATNCLKNKPWKTTHVPTDEVHFLEELADAQHFWIRLWLYIFGSPQAAAEAMYKMYFKKSEVNKFRQETKY